MYDQRGLDYRNHKLLVAVERDDINEASRLIADGVDETMGFPNALDVAIINRCSLDMVKLLIRNIRLINMDEAYIRYGSSHGTYKYLEEQRKKLDEGFSEMIKASMRELD